MAFFTEDYELRSPQVRRTGERTLWNFAGVGDERMSLRSSRFQVDLRSQSHDANDYIIGWIRGGRSTMSVGSRTLDMVPGVPVVLPFDQTYDLHHRDIALNLVHLDRAFLTEVNGGADPAFETLQVPSPEGIRIWQETVREHSASWLDTDTAMPAAAQRDIAEAFAHAALRAFPRRSMWHASVVGRGPEHERLRLALEYVHAHARDAIGTSEIAAAAGLSPRGLQQSLRRHLEQTPGDLLRSVRLEGAHADLVRAQRDELTVADIARSWGFGHLGRFSASYRERYGELPSETLRARG